MKLSTNVKEKILAIDFLSHNKRPNVSIGVTKTLLTAEKSINSRKWENLVLEKVGDITSYLALNHPNLYQNWNMLVRDSKATVLPKLQLSLNYLVENGKLKDSMLAQIKFDILNLTLYYHFLENGSCPHFTFFDNLYEIYSSGYIPCGRESIGLITRYKVY
ncbi:hypothetical protein [Streptococcus ruminantium]|uniref:hypothetical protein n=1 Tax=Streptococcus ruminantium TaxID=1917441 RepID=UPI0012DE2337|nr:hypothetical protein [Streptococcus ruminantium]